MIISLMEEKDIPAVCEIENNTFSMPWSEKSFLDSIKNSSNLYLTARIQDEIIGYCGLWGVAGEGQINNVAVKANYRNRKVGYTMLAELLLGGRRMGLSAFTLEVRVSNHAAIRLYHKLGFQDAGIRKNFYEHPVEDALIMWIYQ